MTNAQRSPLTHQSGAFTGWEIHCDFDGTISRQDVTDTLLNRFGQRGWQAYEDAWERGEIGSRECMVAQIALLDMSKEELDHCLDTIEIDPGFIAFAAAARHAGIPLIVVSDGLDYAITRILAREGITDVPVRANRLLQHDTRAWRLETPWASPVCPSANCKCRTAREAASRDNAVLYIGDGSSDFCVSKRARLVLAKGKLIDFCQTHRLPFQSFNHFEQLMPTLERIVASTTQDTKA
ncbi:MtnX-like HAD-IB family phosphatase [Carnimonas bestiolae]|uniref:MtnX-like HAD-IB family phosphatase n=1 Tax=Carnimonas bestiolae TaxID=3402172 RepID=UPI003EDC46CF